MRSLASSYELSESALEPGGATQSGPQPKPAAKSNRAVSALSGLGITLVVLGHAQVGPPEPPQFATFVRWIYTFHMPLFFAVSGYVLMRMTLRGGALEYPPYAFFLRTKARRLLAPYLLISSLTFPIKAALSRAGAGGRALEFSFASYLEALFLPWHNAIIFFWFLPTLFLAFALAPAFLRRRSHAAWDGLLLATCAGLWFALPNRHEAGPLAFLNAGGLLHNFLFFAVGFMCAKYRLDRFHARISPAWMALGPVSFACFALWRDLLWVSFLLAFVGLLFATAVARWQTERFARIGDYSFDIYLFSWFPQIATKLVLTRLHAHAAVIVLGMLTTGVVVPIALAEVRKRIVPASMRFALGG